MIRIVIPLVFVGVIVQPRAGHADSMFDGFWRYCVMQALTNTAVQRDDLTALSAAQITELAENLGFSSEPEAIWVADDGGWSVVDMQRDEIGNCTVMSLSASVDANVSDWNEALPDSFRSKGPAGLSRVNPSRRAGGWATTPVDDGFVQVSLTNFLVGERPTATIALLTAARVGNSPASCELFPTECN
ncbi:hypothetical protein MWU60_05920 [Yoonia sp. F2084L]|uniref:hypothetical protein n=1 Tax=Yoonia sp. F2084L TaxID=2926419 RepID=UPI001FF14F0C|nr:hypothetical protein [Yoonia sp. F2084L]MCK0095099.1 hypothetical protein [Yoonia sp. F2084L]